MERRTAGEQKSCYLSLGNPGLGQEDQVGNLRYVELLYTHTHTHTHADRHTQTDTQRQTHRHTERQNRHTETETDRYTHTRGFYCLQRWGLQSGDLPGVRHQQARYLQKVSDRQYLQPLAPSALFPLVSQRHRLPYPEPPPGPSQLCPGASCQPAPSRGGVF